MITWNIEGTTTTEEYEYGTTPSYKNGTPEKTQDDRYTYVFNGWNPSPVMVTAHATYTAQFKRTPIIYSVEFIESAGDNSVSLLVPKESNCVLIFAAYDTNGSLLSVELKPLSFDTAKEDTVEPETLKTDGAASIKVMLWDGIDTMKPLCTADEKSL